MRRWVFEREVSREFAVHGAWEVDTEFASAPRISARSSRIPTDLNQGVETLSSIVFVQVVSAALPVYARHWGGSLLLSNSGET